MSRVLTVDDSRAIRAMVSKQLAELGLEVDEAEDGTQGLVKLEECTYDLVLLDVTMPVMDGPSMLSAMRARGDQTPVLMLTSESKRSIVSAVMKDGITDYVLKPFKPEELRAKVQKVIKNLNAPALQEVAPMASAASLAPSVQARPVDTGAAAAGRQFIDILLIDDMENVQKKLRTLVPQHLTMNHSVSAQSALGVTRERVYRVVLIDIDIPDVNSAVLMRQIRLVQPHAAFIALCLRSNNNTAGEAKDQGFDSVLYKPFDQGAVDDFLLQYFDNQDMVAQDDNVMTVSPFSGKEDRLGKYFDRLMPTIEKMMEKTAAACFDDAIVDLSKTPSDLDRLTRLAIALRSRAKQIGVRLLLVGTQETQDLLLQFEETKDIQFFSSIPLAKAA